VGEDNDDTREDVVALFDIDIGSGSAPIDLDGDGGDDDEGATTTGTPVASNSSSPSVAGTSSIGKRKSDFDKVYETGNGRQIYTKATCKMCKHTLSARSSADTGHLKRHQKSCRQKSDQATRVQSMLAYNPDGSVHNWDYKPNIARSKLCRLIVRLDLSLGIGET